MIMFVGNAVIEVELNSAATAAVCVAIGAKNALADGGALCDGVLFIDKAVGDELVLGLTMWASQRFG